LKKSKHKRAMRIVKQRIKRLRRVKKSRRRGRAKRLRNRKLQKSMLLIYWNWETIMIAPSVLKIPSLKMKIKKAMKKKVMSNRVTKTNPKIRTKSLNPRPSLQV
jgi:hypothetical protein